MAFVPAPNICQLEMRAVRNGQKIENRIMVNMLAEPEAAAMMDVAIAAWDWWENTYAPLLSDTVLLTEVVATSLHEQNGPQVTYAPDATTTGEVGGNALPNECTLCVSLRSDVRGRSARGRFYVLSIADSQRADNNNVSSGAAEAFRTAVALLFVAIRAESVDPVIVSYQTNNAPRPGGPVYFSITNTIVVDTVIDSMKSRKPGVGN